MLYTSTLKVYDSTDVNGTFMFNTLQELKAYLETLPESNKNKKPDIEKIEDILCEIYGVNI
jgi:hypothetical protein